MSIPEDIRERLIEALQEGEDDVAEAVALEALAANVDPLALIQEVMIPTLEQIGVLFQEGEIFVPELLLSGRAAERVSKHMERAIESQGLAGATAGVVVLGTVKGDIHDIGKNIVATMFRAHGFKVIDLGRDVAPSAFVDAAVENHADLIGLSSLMTTTRPNIKNTIALFTELNLRERFKIIVGGGSVTRDWAASVGADGYSEDAVSAVELGKQLLAG